MREMDGKEWAKVGLERERGETLSWIRPVHLPCTPDARCCRHSLSLARYPTTDNVAALPLPPVMPGAWTHDPGSLSIARFPLFSPAYPLLRFGCRQRTLAVNR